MAESWNESFLTSALDDLPLMGASPAVERLQR